VAEGTISPRKGKKVGFFDARHENQGLLVTGWKCSSMIALGGEGAVGGGLAKFSRHPKAKGVGKTQWVFQGGWGWKSRIVPDFGCSVNIGVRHRV